MRRLAVSLVFIAAAGVAVAQPRAVVELFTSQGCSSCPPADRLVTELARDPSLLALSLPVDYWDYLGWKDTLARHDFSMRQHAYAEGRGDRDIYTPQVVVNGLVHGVGSDRALVEKAIVDTAKGQLLPVPVSIVAGPNNEYHISVGAGSGSGEVLVAPLETSARVIIERGENSGTTATYTNVVRAMRKVADYSGAPMTLTLARSAVTTPNADAFAVLVQKTEKGCPNAILGAALERSVAMR
ncbi:DUF1223 domain-containing protein [Labrys wisconsinensis]|uniref:DUF1223 domain-containing protein n=1 Tax=Labrys wisconsinensis TaxID=425677 RepID=A0ABU0JP11_9HYPH|nr:DUF1223 domain-containing protein [Labrys wisconsinensis]MDQ0475380.1 hypothetical protein [Labrys wisconsinensis]